MMKHVFMLIFCAVCGAGVNFATLENRDEKKCKGWPDETLEEILGSAFNPRYMSVEKPLTKNPDDDDDDDDDDVERSIGYDINFFSDEDYENDDQDRPAWSVLNHVDEARDAIGLKRYKRNQYYLQQWHCRYEVKWIDLGRSYFPRYLKTVECLSERCWYEIYKCKPKSFTVKILKRRDKCVQLGQGYKVGITGLPKELRELWVWEERAINFCCDCSL